MTMITVVLMAFFTLASSIKLIGWQKKVFETQLAFFKSYGLNRQIMFLVGMVELSAVILFALGLIMTLSLSNALGAVVIALTSLGAIFFHLRFDTFSAAIPALVTLTLSTALLWLNGDVIVNLF